MFNRSTIKDYIYPTNHPKRDYQFDIIRACFTDNCLVALPTGLGKTFIAGVVMLNCGFVQLFDPNPTVYRWFPSGKIVFLAPTKPLVNQQIEACQLTCGIPSADAAVMTGSSVSAAKRARLVSLGVFLVTKLTCSVGRATCVLLHSADFGERPEARGCRPPRYCPSRFWCVDYRWHC